MESTWSVAYSPIENFYNNVPHMKWFLSFTIFLKVRREHDSTLLVSIKPITKKTIEGHLPFVNIVPLLQLENGLDFAMDYILKDKSISKALVLMVVCINI